MIVPTLQSFITYEMVNVIAVMIVCVHKMALDPVLRRVLQYLPSNVKCNSTVKWIAKCNFEGWLFKSEDGNFLRLVERKYRCIQDFGGETWGKQTTRNV